MRRLAAILLFLPIGMPAHAATPGPVCREPSVVDEITRQVRALHYYSVVRANLITEEPTTDPRVVRCQVCVQLAPYDTLRFGENAVERCVAEDFEVQIVTKGFVVRGPR